MNTSGRRSQISADYLICAIPFTVLRSIEVSPAFSEGKQRAIRELTYNSVTRVYVQSPTRSWIADGLSGYAATDLPIGTVWDCTEGQPGARGILECYTSGERARRLASLSEPQRIRTVVENLQKVFPRREPRKSRIGGVGRRSTGEGRLRLVQAGSDVDAAAAHRAPRRPRIFRRRAHLAVVRLDAGRARIRQSRGS